MSNLLQYRIADLAINIHSNTPLAQQPSWAQFHEPFDSQPDFTYHCSMRPALPQLAQADTLRRYYDHVKERYYALTELSQEHMTIHLAEENLPWGSEVSQLYTQLALTHILLTHEKLLLHASYILTEYGAILFTAPSGTGKSTQAELWKKYRNVQIINGDRAVIGLRGAVAYAHGYPLSGSSTDCRNISSKILAVVALKQAPQNSIRSLSLTERIQTLVNGSYLPEEYSADMPLLLSTAITLTQALPIIELSCLPDESAVDALQQALIEMGYLPS